VYSIADPAQVHDRVYLATKMPVYMLVEARRIDRKPIFQKTPQQSDYQTQWQTSQKKPTAEGGKLEYDSKWAKKKDLQLHWLPKLCRLNPLFFWPQMRRRSFANRKNFKPA
jgi:hypothetical protein